MDILLYRRIDHHQRRTRKEGQDAKSKNKPGSIYGTAAAIRAAVITAAVITEAAVTAAAITICWNRLRMHNVSKVGSATFKGRR